VVLGCNIGMVRFNRDVAVKKNLLSDQIYEVLRERIKMGFYPPRTRLKEGKLAEEMGVSRTPIREALRRLEREGYVVILPGKGAYVRWLSLNEMKELIEIRSILEAYATRLVAEKKDEALIGKLEDLLKQFKEAMDQKNIPLCIKISTEFHETIYRNCGNKNLYEIIKSLRDQFYQIRILLLEIPGMMETSWRDHLEIVRLLRENKIEKIEDFVRNHIMKTIQIINQQRGFDHGEEN
jgi:DNA-binding GntR family transcriptional regulator